MEEDSLIVRWKLQKLQEWIESFDGYRKQIKSVNCAKINVCRLSANKSYQSQGIIIIDCYAFPPEINETLLPSPHIVDSLPYKFLSAKRRRATRRRRSQKKLHTNHLLSISLRFALHLFQLSLRKKLNQFELRFQSVRMWIYRKSRAIFY